MNNKPLDTLMDTMTLRGIPGCQLCVTLHGETVYSHSSGFADTLQLKAVSQETLWWIYSATKISTCIAAMQLIEQGKLHLEDEVSQYLPAYANTQVKTSYGIQPSAIPLRIWHLFTMTGGLDYDMKEKNRADAMMNKEDTVTVANKFAIKPLDFEPGTHYQYSLCHDVLGAVISVISGMPLSEYLKKNVWSPLGMESTGFHPDILELERFADMFTYDHALGKAIPMVYQRPDNNPNYESGGGGAYSCAEDYIKLMTALASGGRTPEGIRILKEETVKLLEVNQLAPDLRKEIWPNRLYGYGWGLCGRVHINRELSLSRSSVGEFGWDGAAAAYALADRKNEVAIVFLAHVFHCDYAYNWLHPIIRNTVYEGLGIG